MKPLSVRLLRTPPSVCEQLCTPCPPTLYGPVVENPETLVTEKLRRTATRSSSVTSNSSTLGYQLRCTRVKTCQIPVGVAPTADEDGLFKLDRESKEPGLRIRKCEDESKVSREATTASNRGKERRARASKRAQREVTDQNDDHVQQHGCSKGETLLCAESSD